jgi:hypothetical protein
MLHIDLPTRREIEALSAERGDPCVSIYVSTTPVTQQAQVDRIELKNLAREAVAQLEAAGTDKRRVAPIAEALAEVVADEAFWAYQAHSLAIFVTPERLRSFRLPNRLQRRVEVSDRFHVKPLLRAITFPHAALVLVLAEGGVRLVSVSPELPPETISVAGMPKDASEVLGPASQRDRGPGDRAGDASDARSHLRYVRAVDAALRPLLKGEERPLILAAAEPLASAFPAVCGYPHLAAETIAGNAERMSDAELAAAARGVLDRLHAAEIERLAALYAERENQGRATGDIAQAARAATFGAIDTLIVDMDATVAGTVDDPDGAVHFAEANDAVAYGVIDEIAARALRAGARVLAARRADIPGGGELAAILRYPV